MVLNYDSKSTSILTGWWHNKRQQRRNPQDSVRPTAHKSTEESNPDPKVETSDRTPATEPGNVEATADPSATVMMLNPNDFIVQGKIGSGHFGKIYRATYRNKVRVALKQLSKEKLRKSPRGTELLRREILIHSRIQHHPSILSFMGYMVETTHVSLVLEYAAYGDLLRHMCRIESSEERLMQSRLFVRQVMQALEHLSHLRIAHRDIKPENILLVDHHQVKLCDFGWSVHYVDGTRQSTLCGTPEYVAPEILSKQAYLPQYVDLWSVGVLAFEFYFGETPFACGGSGASSQSLIFEKIRRFQGFCVLPTDRNPDYKDFVSRLLQVTPTSRMLPAQALQHEFLTSTCTMRRE